MCHLTLKLVKHQIYSNTLPTYPKSFIGMKQVWPQPQPPKQSEVKFKIYTPLRTWLWIHLIWFQCFWITVVKLMAPKKFFWFKDIFLIDICTLLNVMRLFEKKNSHSYRIAFFPIFSPEKKVMIVRKFWAVPPSAFETVS